MSLELDSLRQAVASLERALKTIESAESDDAMSDEVKELLHAGVIQNFEFTYELCWKFMKRWLEINIGGADVDGVTRRELFRRASENGLISDVDRWMEYHHARNITSHTYDQNTAEEVFEAAAGFSPDAKAFLEIIEKKND